MPGSEQAPPAPRGNGQARGQRDGRASMRVVWWRCAQFVLDVAVLALVTCLPLALVLSLPKNPDGTVGNLLIATLTVLVVLLASVAVSAWYWVERPVRHGGRTVAMGWLGLRVVSADGRPASRGQLAGRWVLLLVDAALLGSVGLASMVLTSRRQRLGDVVADTVVVHDA